MTYKCGGVSGVVNGLDEGLGRGGVWCDGDDRVDGRVKEQSLERGILRLFRTDYHL